jgi:hypothetical protein
MKLGVTAFLRQTMNMGRGNILAAAWQNISLHKFCGHD